MGSLLQQLPVVLAEITLRHSALRYKATGLSANAQGLSPLLA